MSGLVLILTGAAVMTLHIGRGVQSSFDTIEVGQTENSVVRILGKPSVTEYPAKPFTRYADRGCEAPCFKRFWYENRLMLDTEAWSISIDRDGLVVGKYHWVSP